VTQCHPHLGIPCIVVPERHTRTLRDRLSFVNGDVRQLLTPQQFGDVLSKAAMALISVSVRPSGVQGISA